MIRVLFVCHGNICRSPMAEFVMKDLVGKAGLSDLFHIESAATSTEEIWNGRGNPVYPPARRKLAEHGISCEGKTARQTVRGDYGKYDWLIGMDRANIRNMQRIYGGDSEGKICLLMDFTKRRGEVADPWYTGDFESTWQDVLEGCEGLLQHIMEAEKIKSGKPDFSFLKNRTPGVVGESKIHHSAVAVTLLERQKGDGYDILFEVRSEKIGHQPGDVCCPGGMVEEGETPEEAVVREMTEELLVDTEQIEVLGPADIFNAGNMMVHPFVCRLKNYAGTFSTDEVEEVFRIPLKYFLETDPQVHEVTWHVETGDDFPFEMIHGGRAYPWRKRKDRILFYENTSPVIWGMTAKIMESFAALCREAGIK